MISSVIVAISVLFLVWILRRIFLLCRLPCGPWGFPLLGSGLQLNFENIPGMLIKWQRKYGDIFSFSLPVNQDVVVVSSDELIYEVLVRRSAEFSTRPESIRLHELFKGCVVGFGHYTPQWRVLKNALTVSLKRSGESLLVLENTAISAVQEMVEKWKLQSGNIINPNQDISDVVYRNISSLVFHKEFSQKEAKTWAEITNKVVACFSEKAQYLELFPWLRHLPNADWQYLKDTNKEMTSFINNQIKLRMERFDGINPQCTLDALILNQKKYNKEVRESMISDSNITYMCSELMGAGLTSIHRTIYAMLAILADPDHAHIVKEMQKEIDANIGNETFRMADKHKLPYVEAFILESHRYWTLSSILNPHAATVDTTLAGFTVPKGTWIWPNVFNLSHDTRYWDYPWKFDPTRFLDKNGQVVPPDHYNRYRLLTFSAGLRVCPGQIISRNRLFLIITSIVQNFNLSPAPGKAKPNHDCRKNFIGGLLAMPEDYEILIHSRYT